MAAWQLTYLCISPRRVYVNLLASDLLRNDLCVTDTRMYIFINVRGRFVFVTEHDSDGPVSRD